MQADVSYSAEVVFGAADHLVGDIDAVNLAEVAAERAQQASGSAADLERGGGLPKRGSLPLQLHLEGADLIGAGGEELFERLVLAPEGDIVIGVFLSAIVPIGTHGLENGFIRHGN